MIWFLLFVIIFFIASKANKSSSLKAKTRPIWTEYDFPQTRIQTNSARTTISMGERYQSKKLDTDLSKFWVPPTQTVTISKVEVSSGFIYLGSGLKKSDKQFETEPSLISPNLAVEFNQKASKNAAIGYWITYNELTPSQRGVYINWLANGRSDPDIHIDYVYLFFYGLERRLLVDLRNQSIKDEEVKVILSEIDRLGSLYSKDHSINSHAASLQSFIESRQLEKNFYDYPPSYKKTEWDMPPSNRLALSQLSRDRMPLPPEWALAWVLTSPFYYPRTPAHRCESEFRKLFLLLYSHDYPKGLAIPSSKRKLRIAYQPLTNAFSEKELPFNGLQDVSSSENGVITKLASIANSCCEKLNAYSRFLGRGNSRESSMAKSLLPTELHSSESLGQIFELKKMIEQKIEQKEYEKVESNKIKGYWLNENQTEEDFLKSFTINTIELLEKWGLGVEPDVRFKGTPFHKSEHCIVFRLRAKSPSKPSTSYLFAAFFLKLAASVANSSESGNVDRHENVIMSCLDKLIALDSAERFRARHNLKWLMIDKPKTSGLTKEIQKLKPDQKIMIKNFLIAISAIDGRIEPSEVKSLKKIYDYFDFEESTLFSDLHEFSTNPEKLLDQPISISRKQAHENVGHAIPKKKSKDKETFSLDLTLIEKKLAESQQASALLKDVFKDDEAIEATQTDDSDDGLLDARHQDLLKTLISKSIWPRDEVLDVTKKLGLLMDGALEKINDYGFEKFDQPIWEGENPIEINPEIMKREVS